MQERRGDLFIISSPSGAGKTTLVRALLKRHESLRPSISYTTRPPRDGEVDGQDYRFVSDETFEAMIAEDAFAEWAEVHGNRYGTGKKDLEALRDQGFSVVFDIDVQGALALRKTYAEAKLVFVYPPSMADLEKRLVGRGTDDREVIQARLSNALGEIKQSENYTFSIVNDDLERAVSELEQIVLGRVDLLSVPRQVVAKLVDEYKQHYNEVQD